MEETNNAADWDPDLCECCGMRYDAFRCSTIASYADAYHQIAWTREHTSRGAVLAHWGRCKREEWERHVELCGSFVVPCDDFDPADFRDDVAPYEPTSEPTPESETTMSETQPSEDCDCEPCQRERALVEKSRAIVKVSQQRSDAPTITEALTAAGYEVREVAPLDARKRFYHVFRGDVEEVATTGREPYLWQWLHAMTIAADIADRFKHDPAHVRDKVRTFAHGFAAGRGLHPSYFPAMFLEVIRIRPGIVSD